MSNAFEQKLRDVAAEMCRTVKTHTSVRKELLGNPDYTSVVGRLSVELSRAWAQHYVIANDASIDPTARAAMYNDLDARWPDLMEFPQRLENKFQELGQGRYMAAAWQKWQSEHLSECVEVWDEGELPLPVSWSEVSTMLAAK